MTKRILIIAGETSGDQHAAKLILESHNIDPDILFFGIGGGKMREAGAEILVDCKNIAVVGAVEILQHINHIYYAWKKVREVLRQKPPDLVILIDYPKFNLHIAKLAKKAGIKVLYYISPQIWAWHQSRIKIIRQRVDKMLVIFPFEEEMYRQAGVPVEFVGHPLLGRVKPDMTPAQAREYLHIGHDGTIIGLLPGSRKGEIKRLLPTLLAAAQQLKKRYPNAIFVLPLALSLNRADLEPYLKNVDIDIKIIPGHFYDVMQLCDAAIVTSGTATLETALLGIPMVIVYKTAASTYFLAKKFIKIPYIGLCNVVEGRFIVKELIQHEASPENITAEICKILEDKTYRSTMLSDLQEIKTKLGKGGGSAQAARAVIELLKK